ncbi:MAG: Asp-tRNA(Asn)/Glu-tRNA(Gln) amidotransferase subunit GatC [Planctomycetota bacterium]
MNELDTIDFEPLAHCLAITNVFREDSVKESFATERALVNFSRCRRYLMIAPGHKTGTGLL